MEAKSTGFTASNGETIYLVTSRFNATPICMVASQVWWIDTMSELYCEEVIESEAMETAAVIQLFRVAGWQWVDKPYTRLPTYSEEMMRDG